MVSRALRRWSTARQAELDVFEDAAGRLHASNGRGQLMRALLIDAYVLLLAAHFQEFCRDLHSEAAVEAVAGVRPEGLRWSLRNALTQGRGLDRKNAHPSVLADDFGRFGINLNIDLLAHDRANAERLRQLESLVAVRNAIANKDFRGQSAATSAHRTVSQVNSWRNSCAALAQELDSVVADWLARLSGTNGEE